MVLLVFFLGFMTYVLFQMVRAFFVDRRLMKLNREWAQIHQEFLEYDSKGCRLNALAAFRRLEANLALQKKCVGMKETDHAAQDS